ncbi:MAG: YebC/PmpR family DNA-binding transcriptional regulator [Luminiphilus sp.]|jgi:YebC/PmpR family DNA-binding regulatory protein|nr:YebC/PmpR family DNA-binding transcriptional regulator [Halieaceae bacterium]RPG91265.1 MAG: YebC/PmpR family DNA-binding transcriptional regulator [Cellvibrionales bacterium TMED157]
MGRAYQNRKESMAKTAAMKTAVYSRYSREIYMAAKGGGTDPAANLTLRSLLDRAKKDQVPSHVIEKAIDKAGSGVGEDFQIARYEGFGPGGTMLLVDCLTDNANRTIGEVRPAFTKGKGKMGTPGTVAHMFEHAAVFVFQGDEESVLECLIMADVDVLEVESEGDSVTVIAPNTEFAKARNALTAEYPDIDFDVDEIQFVPKGETIVTGEDAEQFEKLLDLLNKCEDVQNVFHDAKLD